MSNIYRDVIIEFDKINSIGELEIVTGLVADEAVTTDKIVDEAVTTDKIADGAITNAKLDDKFCYGWTNSAAGAEKKTINIPESGISLGTLEAGDYLVIKFLNGNWADSFYLADAEDQSITRQVDIPSPVAYFEAGLYIFRAMESSPVRFDMINVPHEKIWRGTVTTPASTADKVAVIEQFILYKGAIVILNFSQGNTATMPTLNINAQGATRISFPVGIDKTMPAGTYIFQYWGSSSNPYWELIGSLSQENFTTALKTKLDGIEAGAGRCVIYDWINNPGHLEVEGIISGGKI